MGECEGGKISTRPSVAGRSRKTRLNDLSFWFVNKGNGDLLLLLILLCHIQIRIE